MVLEECLGYRAENQVRIGDGKRGTIVGKLLLNPGEERGGLGWQRQRGGKGCSDADLLKKVGVGRICD